MDPQAPAPQRNWWSRNWKWLVPILVLLVLLVIASCGGFFYAVFSMIKNVEPYQRSVELVQRNAEVRAELGTPIEIGFMPSGSVNLSGASGTADLAFSVSGPKGGGTVYVVATKSAGQWSYDTMVCEIDATGERIDLRPQGP